MPIYPTLKAIPQGLGIQRQVPSRVPRRPKHSHHLRHRPYVLQPFCIAPVLAGETMQHIMLQDRVVTDPVKGRLVGWNLEHWYFYVPLRSLNQSGANGFDAEVIGQTDGRTVIEDMLMDQSQPLDAVTYATAASSLSELYEYDAGAETGNMVHWLRAATRVVSKNFFRDEGDTTNLLEGLPILKMNTGGWTDSVFKASELPSTTMSTPIDTVPDPDESDVNIDTLDGYYQTYLALKQQTLSDLTFEDYLSTFGVKNPKPNQVLPELLMYRKAWSYPTNTIGTSGDELGDPSSALSWSVVDRTDKRRFFKEPGFIIGFTCARPKLYIGAQRGYAAMHMADAFSWMPASLRENVETTIKRVVAGEGVLGGTGYRDTDAYIFDIRDLLLHGDQYVAGVALDGTAPSLHVALDPHDDDTHDQKKFVDQTDLMSVFVDTTNGRVEHDGLTSLSILGTQVDHT